MFLADEGFNGKIVRHLRNLEYSVDWVAEINASITDEQVIKLAKDRKTILLTEDKDFGEWVFAHNIDGLTIIFLRYTKQEYDTVLNFLISIIEIIINEPLEDDEFITINKNKIRRRKI